MQFSTISSKKIFFTLIEEIERQGADLLIWLLVGFAIGIGYYFSLAAEPDNYRFLWIGLVMGGMGIAARLSTVSVRVQFFSIIFLVMSFFAIGFSWAQWHTQRIAAPILETRTAPIWLTAEIHDIERLPNATRLILHLIEVEETRRQQDWPAKARIQFRNLENIPRKGDIVRARIVMNPPPAPILPYGYDFQRMAYFNQWGAVGYGIGQPELIERNKDSLYFENFRQSLITKIEKHVGAGDRAAVMAALLTGERRQISDKAIRDIRESGLAHLLAISGLHIGLVAGILFFFARALMAMFSRVALRFPIKKIAALIAFSGALIYMLSVGASVPTQRALIMTGIVILGILFDRTVISMRLWAIAAFVVLWIAPESLINVSFQLSFAAVFALIAFYQWAQPRLNTLEPYKTPYRKAAFYFIGIILTSLVASLATTPYALVHFQKSSLIGIASNMAAIPLVGFWIMPMAILVYITQIFGAEAWPMMLMGYGVDILLAIAAYTRELDFGVVRTPEFPPSFLPLFSLGMVILVLWKGYARITGALLIALSLVALFMHERPDFYIANDMRVFAFADQEENIFYVSSTRRQKFTTEGWAKRLGLNDIRDWEEYNGTNCNPSGCIIHYQGLMISLPETPRQTQYDCRHADIVIARRIPRYCQAKTKISRYDLRQRGNMVLWLKKGNKQEIRALAVNDVRGKRPWVR